MKSSTKGILTVIGGFMLHIIVGTVYTMPSISRYFYSYLIANNSGSFTYQNIESVFSINIVVLSCVVPIGVIFTRYIGVINCSCIGLLLIVGSQALMILFPDYQIIQGSLLASAIGSSMAYLPVLITVWKYYPDNKGITTGLCLCAFGLNRLIFKYASLFIINPNHVGLTENKDRYPEEINANFIYYMKLLLCFYCIIGLIAVFLIFAYEESENERNSSVCYGNAKQEHNANSTNVTSNVDDQYAINSTYNMHYSVSNDGLIVKNKEDIQNEGKDSSESLCSLLVSVPFIQLTSMFFCTRIFATIELSSMKKFGMLNGHSESFLKISSFLWKLTNFGFFKYWGLLIDKFGFKKVYMSIILIQITLSSSLYFIAENKILFIICHLLTAAANCGNITLGPVSYTIIFGINNGPLLFSLSSMISNTFYICRPLIRSFVNTNIDFLIFYLIISLFSMFGLIILCFFDEKRHVKKIFQRKQSSVSSR